MDSRVNGRSFLIEPLAWLAKKDDVMRRIFWPFGVVVFLSILAACGGGDEDDSSSAPAMGSISGTITIGDQFIPATASRGSRIVASGTAEVAPVNEPSEFISGEVIAAFKPGVDEQAALDDLLRRYADVNLIDTGPIYPGGPRLLQASAYRNSSYSDAEAKSETRDVIERLRQEETIEYAEFNGIRQAHLIPNDPAYLAGYQWNLNLIQMPAAWEITTGSSNVIVAVLDTGIRNHPDLNFNLLSTGYDFVDNDNDPTEPLFLTASFHGTHVAGTIAAMGNNDSGIAGVSWGTRIMPIRVLGSLGRGTDIAILNGMRYAAGLANSSGVLPPQRARIINMSLAGDAACTSFYQATVNEVVAAGVVVIAAAGNESENLSPTTPASCQGVISVAAVDPSARLASYSNYQNYVTVAAPGGELSHVHNSILSTLLASSPNQFFYKFQQGTSMAAPHVAGVVALMLSANPSLLPNQIKTILSETARAVIQTRNEDNGSVMNIAIPFGLLDARAAVAVAAGRGGNWMPVTPIPFPFPEAAVSFGQISQPMQMSPLRIWNAGGSTLSISSFACWTGEIGFYDCDPGQSWLSIAVSGACGSVLSQDGCDYAVTVNPTQLSFGQQYVGLVMMFSNGGTFSIPIFMQYGPPARSLSIGPLSIQLWRIDQQSGKPIQKVAETQVGSVSAIGGSAFSFTNVPMGQYIAVAGVDANGNGVFGDSPGETETLGNIQIISVNAGQTVNVDIEIGILSDDIVIDL